MVFITGDTHTPVDVHKLSTRLWSEQSELTRDDFVIICGDCGLVWDDSPEDLYWRSWFDKKPFTTLFIDGNHENFNLLAQYPIVDFHGGKAHQIRENIFHLMRGEVFELDGNKYFTMGGAESHDKIYRKVDVTWWEQELPNSQEYDNAMQNLKKHDWNVDYVLTHCAPDSIIRQIADWYSHDKLTNFLEIIEKDLQFKVHYFGHYHMDKQIGDRHVCLYDKIIRIED